MLLLRGVSRPSSWLPLEGAGGSGPSLFSHWRCSRAVLASPTALFSSTATKPSSSTSSSGPTPKQRPDLVSWGDLMPPLPTHSSSPSATSSVTPGTTSTTQPTSPKSATMTASPASPPSSTVVLFESHRPRTMVIGTALAATFSVGFASLATVVAQHMAADFDGTLAPLWVRTLVATLYVSLSGGILGVATLIRTHYIREISLNVEKRTLKLSTHSLTGKTVSREVPVGTVLRNKKTSSPSFVPFRVAGDRTYYLMDIKRGKLHNASRLYAILDGAGATGKTGNNRQAWTSS